MSSMNHSREDFEFFLKFERGTMIRVSLVCGLVAGLYCLLFTFFGGFHPVAHDADAPTKNKGESGYCQCRCRQERGEPGGMGGQPIGDEAP